MFPAVWNFRTNRGKVVYNRPKHRFGFADVLRILKKMDLPARTDRVEKQIKELVGMVGQLVVHYGLDLDSFGGGEFGGGGVTRSIDGGDDGETISR